MNYRRMTRVAALLCVVAGWALAQTPGPFGGFKHDSTLPIEIVSDSLEVRQAESQAIFAGEVIAEQGTLKLTADRVLVRYSAGGGGDSETGAIDSLRAEGNVFVSNGAETAKGAWAEYDVATGEIRMGGGVLLTQGAGNSIAAETFVVDLNTGIGRVDGRVRTILTAPEPSPAGN